MTSFKTTNADSPIKRPTFSFYTNFSPKFLYFAFLNIHRWLKIVNITPRGPDDGSVEPKRFSVDFSINLSFHLDRCYQFFYITLNSIRLWGSSSWALRCMEYPSLPLLPIPLWIGEGVSVWIPSIDQINLYKNHLYSVGLYTKKGEKKEGSSQQRTTQKRKMWAKNECDSLVS